jgi:tetratricopeptide (TPR) repeat protein
VARFRHLVLARVNVVVGDAALEWTPEMPMGACRAYLEKHGIAHLVTSGRLGPAEDRMLDLPFMSAFVTAWDTAVQPLAAWRIVGLDEARRGYETLCDALPPPTEATTDTADSARQLTSFLKQAGLYAAGIAIAEWTRHAREHLLGADHPETFSAYGQLGELHEALGRHDDAEPLYEYALEGLERRCGPAHPETLRSLNGLAMVHESRGRYASAERLFARALEVRSQVLGDLHPETIVSMNNLACLHHRIARDATVAVDERRRRLREAEEVLRRVHEARERSLGPGHPSTLLSMNNLALLLKEEAAEPLLRRALASSEQKLGPDHHLTLTVLNNLALVLKAQSRHDDAEALYERVLEVLERTLGADHPHTTQTVLNLASLHEAQGRNERAESRYLRGLEARERSLGWMHPQTLIAANNLAWFRHDRHVGDPRPLFERLAAAWTDPEDWRSTWIQLGLALCDLRDMGDPAPAERCVSRLVELLGAGHERAVKASERLNAALERSQRADGGAT